MPRTHLSNSSPRSILAGIAFAVGCGNDDASIDSEGADTTSTSETTTLSTTSDPPSSSSDPSSDSTSGMVDSTGTDPSFTLSGAAAKGPLVLGSTIAVSALDEDGSPTGLVFMTQTSSDLGEFSIEVDAGALLSVEAEGFHFNEVVGALSNATVTLRAYYESSGAGEQNAYVNLVTHLGYARVGALMAGASPLGDATEQAEDELRSALRVGVTGFDPNAPGIEMNLLGGDTDANAYLFAVSSVVTQAAVTRAGGFGGPVDANLQELINTISEELADDGMLSPLLTDELLTAQQAVDPEAVMSSLQTRLELLGSSAAVPDLNRILDSDLDGIVNADDNCRRTENPLQEDEDTDGVGDACECGNGTLEEGEVCDDGNTEDDDECSPECQPTCELLIDWEPNGMSALPVTAIGTLLIYADETGLWSIDALGGMPVLLTDEVIWYHLPWGETLAGNVLVFAETGVWATDGTVANTLQISSVQGVQYPDAGINAPTASYEWNGRIYYSRGASGEELWSTDGTAAGTDLVATIGTQAFPEHYAELDGMLYFRTASNLAMGDELWVTDGTTQGTENVASFSGTITWARQIVSTGTRLVFTASSNDGQHLYSSDGTSGGTAALPIPFASVTDEVVAYGGFAYTSGASDGGEGQELWRSDGTLAGTDLVVDLAPGAGGAFPDHFAAVPGGFFFSACGLDCGLWFSDGTAGGTAELSHDAGLGAYPLHVAIDGRYYFPGDGDGLVGDSLWRSDGTSAGTNRIFDPVPGEATMPFVQFLSPVVGDDWVFVRVRRTGDGDDDHSTWRCRR